MAKSTGRKPAVRQITSEYVEGLKQYADVLFRGGLAPKGCVRLETVAAMIEVGRDVGLPVTQALANIAIVNGRPSIYGDGALALVRSSGLLEDFEETFEGEGDTLTAVCRVKRFGWAREKVERYSVADARKAKLWGKEGPWTTAPRRMLMFRARGFALRDEFGDVLIGLIFVEEAMDIPAEPRQAEPVSVVTVPPSPAPTGREAQMQRLAELRGIVMTSKQPADDAAAKAIWSDVLKPYGVESAKGLDDAALAKLITDLESEHCPFTGGAKPAPPPPATTN